MKKVNGGYIVKQFVITVIAALIIGVAAWLALSVRAGLEEHHFQEFWILL